jgi:ADP-ribosylglycohydrolase
MAGQPTDDSELALALARSLALKERFDPDAVLGAYVAWIRSKPFDIGETTRAALEAAAAAPAPEERRAAVRTHAHHHSQANGSLMRVSPLGILGAGRPAEAAAWAREDSALTHPNPVCQEACAAFVAAIATAIGGGADAQQIHAAALAQVASDVRPGAAEVRAALERAPVARPRDDHEHAGWVLVALQHAFHQLLREESFEEGLVNIIGGGGDTDTNAAIAGALLGAARGREAIPRRWRDAVLSCRPAAEAGARHPRPLRFWPVDALELAEALLVAAE